MTGVFVGGQAVNQQVVMKDSAEGWFQDTWGLGLLVNLAPVKVLIGLVIRKGSHACISNIYHSTLFLDMGGMLLQE